MLLLYKTGFWGLGWSYPFGAWNVNFLLPLYIREIPYPYPMGRDSVVTPM